MRREIYIVDGYRTPFCKFGTNLANEPVVNLGISPTKHLFTKTGIDPSHIDHVVFGCCNQPATAIGNVARTIGVRSGVPQEVPAVTVHRNCASGFEAISYACDKACADQGDVFLVGGVENMSQAPFLFSQDAVRKFTNLARSKTLTSKLRNMATFRPGDFSPEVSLKLAMVDPLCDLGMGQTAEILAREYNVTRDDQDQYAEQSHAKALKGNFSNEISPIHLTKDDCIRSFAGGIVSEDVGPRNDAHADKLGRLRTVFDRQGTVTAGNSSQVTDGGAALLVMTDTGLKRTGCKPIAKIIDYEYAGCDPSRMGLGPVPAMARLCHKIDRRVEEADLIEINEAFAAQVLAVLKESRRVFQQIPEDRLNVNGGAIALGHPLAATGTRLAITLAKQLKENNLKHGLASLCVGGGQGGALWIESI